MKKFALNACFALIFYCSAFAQLEFNEICPANISVIQNADGRYDDYVELYNSGVREIDLAGYGISDNTDPSKRYLFPSFSLVPGEKALVFASGSHALPRIHHYELPVSGTGEWRFETGSAVLDSNWRNISFDDSQWQRGEGGIGFGDDDDGTTILPCRSVMMRKSFVVDDPGRVVQAILMMDFDDGFVAYLNGVEIARFNMWPGMPDWDDLASDAHEAEYYQGYLPDSFAVNTDLLKSALIAGTNVLSVETHNVTENSSDLSSIPFLIFGVKDSLEIYPATPNWFHAPTLSVFNADFKLSRSGETIYLFDPEGQIIDEQSYPQLESDHCYARSTDGSMNWCYSNICSPLASNQSNNCYSGYAPVPIFSLAGGFYSPGLAMSLSCSQPGAIIRFSTNGDDPDSSDQVYSQSFVFNSTTTVRARVFMNGKLPGRTISHTYFIEEESKLPVFSISMDSLDLWDENSGIYTLGPNADPVWPYFGANYWQDWDKPAAVEYYDKSKQHIISFNAEIEIYGNYSRSEEQKSFEIKLSDKFGTSELNYPLLPDKPFLTKFENIVLRNSGTDWNVVHFRDALMERLMKNTSTGYLAAEPVRLFLNGQDWGVYTVHEKHNQKWIESNTDLKEGEYDYLTEIGEEIDAASGSDHDFWTMYNFITSNSPDESTYYTTVNSMLDLKNYTDYFIAETYVNNGDWIGEWTNNIKLWKPKAPGSRWKYLLHDLDFGFGLHGDVQDDRLEMARNPIAFSYSSEMFDHLLENAQFKRDFINRYADLMNTIYMPVHVEQVMQQFRDSMAIDMEYHFAKWGSDSTSWHSNIDEMMAFVNQRPAISRSMIIDQFNLNGKVSLSLNVFPAGSGRIEISTVTPTAYPWTGIYFNGNPVTLTAIPDPGYRFDHWGAGQLAGESQIASVNFTSDQFVTAYFSGTAENPKLTISELDYHPDTLFNSQDWLELHNYGTIALDLSGWKLKDELDNHAFVFPTGSVVPADGYLVLSEDTSAFDAVYPSCANRLGPFGFGLKNSEGQIRLFNYSDSIIASFYYQNNLPWPQEADGFGYTCELQNVASDLSDGSNWHPGCYGGSPGSPFSSLLAIDLSVSGSNTICSGSATQLLAPGIPDYNYQWVLDDEDIAGAGNSSFQATVPGTYAVHINNLGCTKISEEFILTGHHTSDIPSVKNAERCEPGSVLLEAVSPDTVFWYTNAEELPLAIGQSFLTPALQASTTFYARAGSVCPSEIVPVNVKILDSCEATIRIYPNPSGQESNLVLHYQGLKAGEAIVQISDVQGKLVKTLNIILSEYSTSCELRVQDLGHGLFFLNLFQENEKYATKILRLE